MSERFRKIQELSKAHFIQEVPKGPRGTLRSKRYLKAKRYLKVQEVNKGPIGT